MKSLLQSVDEKEIKALRDSEILALSVSKPAIFVVLVERWRSRLFARAARLMGNPDDAEDVVQETLVRMYKYAQRYADKEENGFNAWVYSILHNVAKTQQRKRARRGILVEANQTSEDAIEFPDIAEQNLFERLLDLDQVTSVLARLPAACARLLRLHILEGKSYQELADQEGVSVGTIRVRVHRARRDFQNALEGEHMHV